MTRADFLLVADVIRKLDGELDDIRSRRALYLTADQLAIAFKANNPRFKEDVFYQACGISERMV